MNREFRNELDPYREMYDNGQEEFDNPFDGRSRKRRIKPFEYEYKLGGIPKFQSENSEVRYNPDGTVDTSSITVDEDYLMGERPDYVQFYDDKEYMFSGKDDTYTGPAKMDVQTKNTYVFSPTGFIKGFNQAGFAVANEANQPEQDWSAFTGPAVFDTNQTLNDQGGYDLNSGILAPGYTGFEGKVQRGGSIYNVDDEIELTEEEIAEFIRNGGQLEYL